MHATGMSMCAILSIGLVRTHASQHSEGGMRMNHRGCTISSVRTLGTEVSNSMCGTKHVAELKASERDFLQGLVDLWGFDLQRAGFSAGQGLIQLSPSKGKNITLILP